jgi:hypothetical protein
MKTTASMNPAPRAMRYLRAVRPKRLEEIKNPPRIFAPAAASP